MFTYGLEQRYAVLDWALVCLWERDSDACCDLVGTRSHGSHGHACPLAPLFPWLAFACQWVPVPHCLGCSCVPGVSGG